MLTRPPVWTTRLRTPGAGAFAVLFGLEALSRGLITAALPIQTMRLFGRDEAVSALFLVGALVALSTTVFAIPRLVAWMGRARLCTLAILLIVASSGLFAAQEIPNQIAGFVARACGVAVFYASLSMFVMDHIPRDSLGRSEPLRMLSVGIGWTVGPAAGVQIEALYGPWAPFAASALAGLALIAYFWVLRFRSLPIVRPSNPRPQARPFANIALFLVQPRLVLGWLQATGRGVFWASFVIYTPLYAVETGLGAKVGGLLVSLGAGFMLLMPLWGWVARRFGIRRVSLIAFPIAAVCAFGAGLLSFVPWLGALCIILAAAAMTAVDGYGNSLFLRACKPSQRTLMTPFFSTHRDLANIAQAGLFAILLSFFPAQVVYVTLGVVLSALTLLSTKIHERL